MNIISLKKNSSTKFEKELIYILNNDKILNKELDSSNNYYITIDEFNKKNNNWMLKTNSEIFAIIQNDSAIGIISLSHVDKENKTARIGYWLASKFWNQGLTSKAFKEIIRIAKIKKIKTLSATINKNNTASLKLWERYGSVTNIKDEYSLKVKIQI